MRIAALFITGIVFIATSVVIALASPPPELEKLQKEVLGFTAQLNGNCSATLVYSDRDKKSGDVTTLFLTAKHCVADAGDSDQVVDIPVYQNSRIVKKDRYIAKVHGKYYKADLALVELKDRQTWFERVGQMADAKVQLFMGEPTWTVGYPLGQSLTITAGMFTSFETVDYPSPGVEYFRATPDIAPGNSGGALWHQTVTGDYELIGVTTAGYRGLPYMALYTPITDIRAYLDVALPKPE
jgi:hypothetical protein